jgi:demethoxyubiquinone hydroxylase (CLK1/Coq7/Cat5 family)
MSFTRTIRKVDMLVDDFKVLEVSKSVNPKTAVGKKGLRDTSTNGMMKVVGVDKTGMVITARVMKWLSGESVILDQSP